MRIVSAALRNHSTCALTRSGRLPALARQPCDTTLLPLYHFSTRRGLARTSNLESIRLPQNPAQRLCDTTPRLLGRLSVRHQYGRTSSRLRIAMRPIRQRPSASDLQLMPIAPRPFICGTASCDCAGCAQRRLPSAQIAPPGRHAPTPQCLHSRSRYPPSWCSSLPRSGSIRLSARCILRHTISKAPPPLSRSENPYSRGR